jgi:hypothetical protein
VKSLCFWGMMAVRKVARIVRAVMPSCAMCAALRRGEASSGRPRVKDDMFGNFMVGVAVIEVTVDERAE